MELTPETFEKAEFIERRRGGYDIDQVETFLEETGTEFARMLVRFERKEAELNAGLSAAKERTEDLEAQVSDLRQKLALTADRLIDTEQRLEAESAARVAEAAAADSRGVADEPRASDDDVANVAKALVLAQEAADKTLREAKAEARAIVDGANSRSERQMAETTTKIAALVNEAKARADREYASRRDTVLEEVSDLEERRESLAESISRMEARIAGYREDLRRAGQELISVADNPSFLGDGDSAIALAAEAGADADSREADVPGDRPERRSDAAAGDDAAPPDSPEVDDVDTIDPDRGRVDDDADDAPVGTATAVDDAAGEHDPSADGEPVESDDAVPADVVDDTDDRSVQDSPEFDPTGGPDHDDEETKSSAPSTVPEPKIGQGWFNADGDPTESDEEQPPHGSAHDTDRDEDLLDLRSPADRVAKRDQSDDDPEEEWGPGSWSKVEKSLRAGAAVSDDEDREARTAEPISAKASTVVNPVVEPEDSPGTRDSEPTEAIDRVELIRDRYLEELDQAVNTELDAEDEALAAFLEGSGNSKARRFGWRR